MYKTTYISTTTRLLLQQKYSNYNCAWYIIYDIHCRIWRHCTPLLELGTRSTWVTHLATTPFPPFTFSVRCKNRMLTIFLKGLQRNMLVWLNGEHFSEKCLFLFLLVYYVYHFAHHRVSLAHDMHFMFVPLSFSTVT